MCECAAATTAARAIVAVLVVVGFIIDVSLSVRVGVSA